MKEQTNSDCGKWLHPLRCVNYGVQTTLDGKNHDSFVIQKHCYSPDCPVCYEAWASRQANNTAEKLIQAIALWKKAGMVLGRVNHVVFSPPQDMAKELIRTPGGYRTLRSMAVAVMKKAGMTGGALVFHPFRQNDPREPNFDDSMPAWVWYESPHFHAVGCGYLMKSDNFYQLTKWTYKNVGRRESIRGTVKYLLTHCGIADGFQAVTYFGIFSNNKIVIDNEWIVEEPIKCTACGEPLHEYGVLETDNGYEADYFDDKGVYLHKVRHRIYKIRDKVLESYRDKLKPDNVTTTGFIRIDTGPMWATSRRIKHILEIIKGGAL